VIIISTLVFGLCFSNLNTVSASSGTYVNIKFTKICVLKSSDAPLDNTEEVYSRIEYDDINDNTRVDSTSGEHVNIKVNECKEDINGVITLTSGHKIKFGNDLHVSLWDKDWSNPDDLLGGDWSYVITSSTTTINAYSQSVYVKAWYTITVV
jgi:hypothetical protein